MKTMKKVGKSDFCVPENMKSDAKTIAAVMQRSLFWYVNKA